MALVSLAVQKAVTDSTHHRHYSLDLEANFASSHCTGTAVPLHRARSLERRPPEAEPPTLKRKGRWGVTDSTHHRHHYMDYGGQFCFFSL